jgi:hypothetical protein
MTQPQQPQPRPMPYPQQPPQGYPPPPYGPPPGYVMKRKKPFYKKVWFWLLVFLVIIIIVVVSAVSKAADDAVNKNHTVTYKVSGTVPKADISYYTNDGNNRSRNINTDGVKLPWAKTITVKGDFSLYTLMANMPFTSNAHGKLSCQLLVDGKVVSSDTSNGSAGVVSCSGTGYDGGN